MNSYICHHGIKGMHWGVRRYQNKDGSLTPEGEKKYLNEDGTLTKKGMRKYRIDTANYANTIYKKKYGTRRSGLLKASAKKTSEYADKELGLNRLRSDYTANNIRKNFVLQYNDAKINSKDTKRIVSTYKNYVDKIVEEESNRNVVYIG